ncbi:MAG TPA: MBL fold metallo-hydrolase [Anaerolineae bacterium]|nr:MBL fold metallo-hydrolase [Anaerolineae bacterium]
MDKIANSVYVSSEYRGVTVGAIITPIGVIAVDAPLLPSDARAWRAQIASVTDLPVRYIINTDGHRDRVLGQQWLEGAVIATEFTADRMRSYGDTFRQQVADFLSHHGTPAAAEEIALSLRVIQPQIGFTGKLLLHLAEPRIEVWNVGGANPGSAWVVLPDAGVVFVGDLFTLNVHPVMSEANTRLWLDRLAELRRPNFPAKKIVPGRGSVAKKADTQIMSAYLRDVRNKVRGLIKARKSKPDVAPLVAGFLPRFPVAEGERERIQRRIRAGLEHVYDELK